MPRRTQGSGSIRKRSDGRYEGALVIGYTESGNPRRRSVYAKTKRECEAKLAELRVKHGVGELPPPDKLTVAQLGERYLEAKARQVRPKTLESYHYTWDSHIEPHVGRRRLARLNGLHIEEMLSALERDGVSNRNIRYARTVLNGALRQAVQWGLIARNPCDGVAAPRKAKRERVTWSIDDVMVFLDAARGERMYAFLYLAASTGLRLGELLGLEWRDLDGDVLHVRRALGTLEKPRRVVISEVKTEHGRRALRLPRDVLDVLEAHRERQERERERAEKLGVWEATGGIFVTARGKRIFPRNARRVFDRVVAGAGLPRINFHGLRHTHATLLLRSGAVSLTELSARLGHYDPAFTLSVYTHAVPEHQRAVVGLAEMGRQTPGGDDE